MLRYLLTTALLVAAATAPPATAQVLSPPISPQLQLDSQPQPRSQLPPISSNPVGNNATTTSTPLTPSPVERRSRGRAADCQHQAAVDRIPSRDRGSYVANCMAN